MSRKRTIATIAAFVVAGAATTGVAWVAASYVEETSRDAVSARLDGAGMDWADVRTDGLQLILTGFAPDEQARFRAVTEAGRIVDPGRVVDAMDVTPSAPFEAPRFSLEILRNDRDVSLIGLMPQAAGMDLLADVTNSTSLSVTNLVENADYAVPDNWANSVEFALVALDLLPRAKVSVSPGRVAVTAVADSQSERQRLESELGRARPDGVTLAVDIAAPRPVITPFTLRFAKPVNGAPRFEACAIDSEQARSQILVAAGEAGFEGKANCVLGLGVPSASWGTAAAASIRALGDLGAGTVTLSDADVTLVAAEGTARADFDRVAAELETALPDLFALNAVLPEPEDATQTSGTGPQEFIATKSPEGQVQLRGRLFDEAQEAAVLSYGRALFGVGRTYMATREDGTLPAGWPARVLAGLDALAVLENGAVQVEPDVISVRGVTGNSDAEAEITRILSERIGAQAQVDISVEYLEELDPALNIPTPEACEADLNAILVEQKLSFAPGEAVIDSAGEGQLGRLRAKLDDCDRSVFEVGGHTDSQGREEMNLSLSQQRADAVRAALISRGVPPSQLVSKGYGEAQPVADNETEAGREANRRITFTLVGRRDRAGDAAEDETPAEATGEDTEAEAAPSDGTEETGE